MNKIRASCKKDHRLRQCRISYETGEFSESSVSGMIPAFFVLFLSFVFSWSTHASGQSVSISSKFDTTAIMIGEQTNFTITVEQPAGMHIDFPEVSAFLAGEIEILSRLVPDTVSTGDNNLLIKQSFRITSFDPGEHQAGPLPFVFIIGGDEKILNTTPTVLRVNSPEIDEESGIYDIKAPFSITWGLTEILARIFILLVIAFLAWYLIRYLRRRRQEDFVPGREVIAEPPHIVALRDLNALKDQLLWQKGMIREYYTRLTEIVRIYIERRFGIMAMERTSNEIITALVSRNSLGVEPVKLLSECFFMADLVKFAKARPGEKSHEDCFLAAIRFVEDTIEVWAPESMEQNGNNPEIETGNNSSAPVNPVKGMTDPFPAKWKDEQNE
jgi:hypothetical protein